MILLKLEDVPNAIAEVLKGQSEILALLSNKAKPHPEIEIPIQIDELVPIIGKSKPTIYGMVQHNEIPNHKKGNRLYFFKSEITDWIRTGKQKTLKELEAENDEFLSNRKKK